MRAEAVIFLLMGFFQVSVALALRKSGAAPRQPVVAIQILLGINATLAFVSALNLSVGWLAGNGPLYHAVDNASGPAILAVVAVLMHPRASRPLLLAAVALTVVGAILAFVGMNDGPAYVIAVQVPYYGALGLTMVLGARGPEWGRWVALSFAPRALYFLGTDPVRWIASSNAAGHRVSSFLAFTLGLAAIFAVGSMLRRHRPSAPTILVCAGIGPACAIVITSFDGGVAHLIADYLTLAIVRPAVQLGGLAPQGSARSMAGWSLASAVAVAGTWASLLVGFSDAAAVGTSIALGMMTLVIYDEIASRQDGQTSAASESAGNPGWEVLIAALRGSSGVDWGTPVDPRWTQQGLAERTGLTRQRISESARRLNLTAQRKVEERGLAPTDGSWTLIEWRRVHVIGVDRPRTAYRLTPLGEALAQQVDISSSKRP